MERAILHCDANNFFASVETVYNPELKNVPLAITGDPVTRTGIVLAKNNIAKAFGVKTGDVLWEAKRKCPSLVTVKQNRSRYVLYSKKLIEIYTRYTDRVEAFGIDECWLDITPSLKLFNKNQIEIANEIREVVKNELGLTVSVGVSFCKLFAKLGSDLKKPDATTEITRQNFKDVIYPLDISSILGIGRRLDDKFKKIGVNTLGDFVKLNDSYLKSSFNKTLVELKHKLLGNDTDEVSSIFSPPRVKSIGNGTTTTIDIRKKKDIVPVVGYICDEISYRLRAQNFKTNLIHVSVKTSEFKYFSKQRTIPYYTNTAKDLIIEAIKILDIFWDYTSYIRQMRISCSNLVLETELNQLSFFDDENIKKERVNKAIDNIRAKYGYEAIDYANTLKSKVISKDRRK